MVEGNPQKPKMWLWVSQIKQEMMIDDDARGVTCTSENGLLFKNG
jgi:hypothetical protein